MLPRFLLFSAVALACMSLGFPVIGGKGEMKGGLLPKTEIVPAVSDTPVTLKYKFKDNSYSSDPADKKDGGLRLKDPSNIKTTLEYDPVSGTYKYEQKMGDKHYRPPTYLDQEEYQDYEFKQSVKKYWRQRISSESPNQAKPLIPKLHVGGKFFETVFGGSSVDIRPQGTAELIFAVNTNRTDNPALPEKQRKISTFDFNEKIQLNVVGKIGEKLKLTTTYNTEATFDFENQMKLEYTGFEDEIIKKIEAGNVSLPLTGSLITGSQSLFGIKTQLQFGKLTATTIFSQQKGKKSEIEITGGAQTSKFSVEGDFYEANRHYFLAHYFRDQYNKALANLPVVVSDIKITRVEVWVTNKNSTIENTRNIVAFTDLGEDTAHIISDHKQTNIIDLSPDALPFNDANSLYKQMVDPASGVIRSRDFSKTTAELGATNYKGVRDFEKLEAARKLSPSEFNFNSRLGFISLNQALNYDEVLAVAFEYSYNNQLFQVGEFSADGTTGAQPVVVKLLKSTNVSTSYPMWDLMMKNIYAIGAFQVNPRDFKLEVWYNINGVDVPYLTEGSIKNKPLIQVMNLDVLNGQSERKPDGVFDFIEGVTIFSSNGRVIFPVLEPFGSHLRSQFPAGEQALANKYVFQELYDSTRTVAQQFPTKNKFKLKGTFQSSSSSEISLNAPNIPQGAVTVTAGGVQLTENIDYTVDYALGRIKIINEGILNSGAPIKVSLESNALFSIQSKSLMGAHFDYRISKDFTLGGTVLNLTERPLTKKINFGDEPISNTIWGLDGNYRTEAPFLTRLVDKIPFLETKEMSTVAVSGEFANLVPGHAKAIGKDGNSYIDDFEGSQSAIDIKSIGAWFLASTPQGQPALFPEAGLTDSLPYGYNRAKLAWYVVDPLLIRDPSAKDLPSGIDAVSMSNNLSREILETEIFPNKQNPNNQPINIPVLDLAFYPNERGPYNFDVQGMPGISQGIDPNTGLLVDPRSRWGGIMRRIETNDFEATNIEFIQFWIMDPYNSDNANPGTSGDMYINLGNVSEDVLKDSRKSFENGLPNGASSTTPFDETAWGRVPTVQSVVNAFDNNESAREFQDVGYDGLRSVDEASFFQKFMNDIQAFSSAGYNQVKDDPSSDNYAHFRDGSSSVITERYKNYNGTDGNSPAAKSGEQFSRSATTIPNTEDINRDNTMSENESYYQYKISLRPQDLAAAGQNYITDIVTGSAPSKDNSGYKTVRWIQFKVPVKSFEKKIGSIEDFKSIRFIRMFLRDVDKPVVLRFARLELVRGDWRKYNYDLLSPGLYIPNDNDNTLFNVAAVNIEENGSRTPVNYILPPKIEREVNPQTTNLAQINEQSLSVKVCNLEDGKARAVYKNTDLDVRSYKKIEMYVHAEAGSLTEPLNDNDLQCFIRLGTDYTDNYYEYIIPLKVTPFGSYNGSDENQRYIVWPESNQLQMSFASLQVAKQDRNSKMASNPGITLLTEYETQDSEFPKNKIIIRGNPNLSSIKTIMIGIRNPKAKPGSGDNDDGLPKCGEIWINELRLTHFDEKGGWATTARVSARLADFGNLTLAGNWSTPGFGSIEKKVSERQRETIRGYDASGSFELGKFLPENANLRIPMYVGMAEAKSTPKYNPLDPDIELKNVMNNEEFSKKYKDSIRYVTEDYMQRKSINFTNVKKEKGKNAGKAHFYDIENVAVSYAYMESTRRNINLEYNNLRAYSGMLTYNYNATPKNFTPFAKSKILKSKHLSLIKDINFYLAPNRFGFTTDIDRQFNEVKNRDLTGLGVTQPTYNKSFTWQRLYDFRYDITKSLKLDFNATNDARVLEPDGRIDTEQKKDSVISNLKGMGKTMFYTHNTNINYTPPINKIPMMDFVNGSVRYGSGYKWDRGPLSADSLGHMISNNNSIQWTAQLNMLTLYNKVPYLKKINQKKPGVKPPAPTQSAKPAPVKPKSPGSDTTKTKPKDKQNNFEVFEYLLRTVMTLRNASINFTENNGTLLPGYARTTQILGFDQRFEGPGPGFLFGQQKNFGPGKVKDFAEYAAGSGWLVQSNTLNTPYTRTNNRNYNIRANAEPFPDLKIELTANRSMTKNNSAYYKWSSLQNKYIAETPSESGNFSISYITWRTAFKKDDKVNHTSDAFRKFLDYRATISSRLGQKSGLSKPLPDGYWDGFNETSQEVLIPAFLAAYSGKSPNTISLNTFPKFPLPNWRVTYDGLSKLAFFKKYFRTLTLSHAYRSTYNIGGYTTNLRFEDPDNDGFTTVKELTGGSSNINFISQKNISTVSIAEQFSPLARIEMSWNNSLLTNAEYKKDRTLSLALTGKQLMEVSGQEIVIGAGYRFREVPLPIKIGKKKLKSDLNLKADVSIRNNKTAERRIVENVSRLTSGQNIITIKTSADYVINDKLNLRLFYDQIITKPVTSLSFPTSNTNAGISLRFTLSQ